MMREHAYTVSGFSYLNSDRVWVCLHKKVALMLMYCVFTWGLVHSIYRDTPAVPVSFCQPLIILSFEMSLSVEKVVRCQCKYLGAENPPSDFTFSCDSSPCRQLLLFATGLTGCHT